MVVIKATPAIRALYADDRWWVGEAAKTYPWTIKSRNDRRVRHYDTLHPIVARAIAGDTVDGWLTRLRAAGALQHEYGRAFPVG